MVGSIHIPGIHTVFKDLRSAAKPSPRLFASSTKQQPGKSTAPVKVNFISHIIQTTHRPALPPPSIQDDCRCTPTSHPSHHSLFLLDTSS